MKDLGFLFLYSLFYNLAYLWLSSHVTQSLFYIVFLVAIGLIYAVLFYRWVLRIWNKVHPVILQEGLIVMGLQATFMFIVSWGLRQLALLKINVLVLQGISACIYFLWLPVLMSVYYGLACRKWTKKIFDGKSFLCGMAFMGLLLGCDTLCKGVFTLGSFYNLCSSLAYCFNPWFDWLMSWSIGLIFHQGMGKILVSSFLYLVLGFFYAFLLRFYALLIQKRGQKNGIE